MGLIIRAFSKIRLMQPVPRNASGCFDIEEESDYRPLLYPSLRFPGHAEGIEPGIYAADSQFKFPVGSYLTYDIWRAWLALALLGTPDHRVWKSPVTEKGKPFFCLINFTDDDGIIGPKTCAKLFKDFKDYEDTAMLRTWEPEAREIYRHFMYAFEIGSHGGCVQFH